MDPFLPNPDLGANITITHEEFNLFHNIDRQLFTRLVVNLDRDTSQSTHVVAFIMWLEKKIKDFKMVKNLLQWADDRLNNLAEEANLVLNCIESSQFPYADGKDPGLPLIQSITHNPILSLKYFHDIRIDVIFEITKIVNTVCIKAFTDIVQHVQYQRAMKEQNMSVQNIYGPMTNGYIPVMYYGLAPGVSYVPQQIVVPALVPPRNEGSSSTWNCSGVNLSDVESKNAFNEEFSEVLAKLESSASSITVPNHRKEVPPDDRTIFMTFSKGYPTSESEVRDFFTRAYGDVVEAVFMQEVPPPEQPLFARLVVRPDAINIIDSFLEGAGKVKFSINGKHVWARKYVPKANKSPQASSP